MRSLIALTFLLAGVSLAAQNLPSRTLRSILLANNEGRYEDMRRLLWSKSDQEGMVKAFQVTKEKFGPVNYFMKTDSVFKISEERPKKHYELKYNAYCKADLLHYEFILTEEKGICKLVSFTCKPAKGNYDDPLMNSGVMVVAKSFVRNIAAYTGSNAYALLSATLRDSISEKDFKVMANRMGDVLGDYKSIQYLDTCSVLNYYGKNESKGFVAAKVMGDNDTLYLAATVEMDQEGSFYITRFLLTEQLEMNDPDVIKEAMQLVNDFYAARSENGQDKLYALLHPAMQAVQSREDIKNVVEKTGYVSGAHKGHSVVSQIFAGSKMRRDLCNFMLVIKDENEDKTFYDTILLAYDKDDRLKILHFFFAEY